jgi:hypothetical protein
LVGVTFFYTPSRGELTKPHSSVNPPWRGQEKYFFFHLLDGYRVFKNPLGYPPSYSINCLANLKRKVMGPWT